MIHHDTAEYKYIWGTPFGTYTVPCEVKEFRGNRYLIEFEDTHTGELEKRWVKFEDIIWPSYSEYIIG